MTIKSVIIYGFDESIHRCPSCINAKRFCELKKIPYTFISVVDQQIDSNIITAIPNLELTKLKALLGISDDAQLTMPQIFDQDLNHIGGFSDLKTKYN